MESDDLYTIQSYSQIGLLNFSNKLCPACPALPENPGRAGWAELVGEIEYANLAVTLDFGLTGPNSAWIIPCDPGGSFSAV